MISESYYISNDSNFNESTAINRLNDRIKQHFYFKRLFKFSHMDFEYAFWQLCYLFISPQKVYRNFQYRKSLSNRWARDDPAFLVLMLLCFICSSVIFAVALRMSLLHLLKFLLWVIIVDCVLVNTIMATGFWLLCNYLMKSNDIRSTNAVEWCYAFDVQLNAYFPLLIILHFIQLPLLHSIILRDWIISVVVGNTFWLIGILYYFYLTFLGYSVLPKFQYSKIFLYLMSVTTFAYLLSLGALCNLTANLCNFYQYRVI